VKYPDRSKGFRIPGLHTERVGVRLYQAIFSPHCSRHHFLYDTLFQFTEAASARDCRLEHADAFVNDDGLISQREHRGLYWAHMIRSSVLMLN
jgi:hypothetical protein